MNELIARDKAKKTRKDLFGNDWGAKTPTSRRNPKPIERSTPCAFCDYPLTQRHHILPVASFGENEYTIQLCPNCHELYHIVFDSIIKNSTDAKVKLLILTDRFGTDDIRFARAEHWALTAKKMGAI